MNGIQVVEVRFEKEVAPGTHQLILRLPMEAEGMEGTRTLIALSNFYGHALATAQEKSFTYGDAWRRQGWMGNLARMMSKMARLKNMCWRDHSMEDARESVSDSALDLANITGFFAINRSEDNKWGTQ